MVLYYYNKYFLYSFVVRALTIFIIYGCFYSVDVINCMTSDDIPSVAEAKPIRVELSHQSSALKKSIIDYAGDLEQLQKEIVCLKEELSYRHAVEDYLDDVGHISFNMNPYFQDGVNDICEQHGLEHAYPNPGYSGPFIKNPKKIR